MISRASPKKNLSKGASRVQKVVLDEIDKKLRKVEVAATKRKKNMPPPPQPKRNKVTHKKVFVVAKGRIPQPRRRPNKKRSRDAFDSESGSDSENE